MSLPYKSPPSNIGTALAAITLHWSLLAVHCVVTLVCSRAACRDCITFHFFRIALHFFCIALYFTVLHSNQLYFIVFNYIALYSIELHFNFFSIALHCIVLYCILLHCIVLYFISIVIFSIRYRYLLQELEVSSPPGEIIGYVRQKWTFIKPK